MSNTTFWTTVVILACICIAGLSPHVRSESEAQHKDYNSQDVHHTIVKRAGGSGFRCNVKNDVMVALDVSNVVPEQKFTTKKEFVANLLDCFVNRALIRVSFRTFSKTDMGVFDLNNTLTPPQIKDAVLKTIQRRGVPNTDTTLTAAFQQFKLQGLDAPRKLLVITDRPSADMKKTKEVAAQANAAKVTTFAVGYGNADGSELLTIANGDASRKFKVAGVEDLNGILTKVAVAICNS